jgi:hypothetical protein
MREQLPREQAADLAAPDDDGVLEIADVPPAMATAQKTKTRLRSGPSTPVSRARAYTSHDPTVTR